MSNYLVPLFQNESSCKTFHMEWSLGRSHMLTTVRIVQSLHKAEN